MRKVLLVVIDALASRVVLPALEEHRLPCLAELVRRGVLRPECTSIFPSITPAATASIATGVYPTEHEIAGAFWYNREDDRVAYYGDDFWVVIDEGMDQFFNDFMVRLNHDRLHADTLYERVERNGLTAAVINYMWYRGRTRHEVDAPWLFKLMPNISVASEISGPQVLAMADFAASKIPGRDEKLSATGGISRRFGFHDDTTADYLMHLASADPFPEFTLAYFPNNDYDSHADGPVEALDTLEKVDTHLAEFIKQMGGMDQFLENFAIVICGDHSQTDQLRDPDGRGINLVEILEGYQLTTAGQPWEETDELMVCPNMRACHIYLKDRSATTRGEITEQLLNDPRVDQVLWRDGAWEDAESQKPINDPYNTYHIVNRSASLKFHRVKDRDKATGRDPYGINWICKGSLDVIDASVSEVGTFVYGEYPNALERIATGFCRYADDMWVTAKPGCEFEINETAIHPGGSHGALNRGDSCPPLIVAGVPEEISIPESPRTIDIAPLCLQILGLEEEAEQLIRSRRAGRPH
ncbi:MAG: alkaline phosphatase family protein [Planctomycetaceae bacterium]|nr:alkaline phosphatase family protein [Planctomycetaceae bacterium]